MYIYMLPFHISVIINCASIQKISFSRSHLILDKSWTTPGMVPSQSEDTYLNNHSTIGQNSKSSISLNCQIVKRVNMQGSHWKAIGIYHLKCSDGQLNILYILARRKTLFIFPITASSATKRVWTDILGCVCWENTEIAASKQKT